MSNANLLWKFYLEDDVDSFRQLLAGPGYSSWIPGRNEGGSKSIDSASLDASLGSPGQLFSTSPHVSSKARKISGRGAGTPSATKGQVGGWTKATLNSKDRQGLTVLHHAASSTGENAVAFASILLEHPLIDLYVQDLESGWTALHRALYFGNITIARGIMRRDASDLLNHHKGSASQGAGRIFKVKDKDGNGPFDLVGVTIAKRQLHDEDDYELAEISDEGASENGENETREGDDDRSRHPFSRTDIGGEEVFAWGSNKNVSLGLGNEDDRQYPERICLTRPDHLFQRFAHTLQEETLERLKAHPPNTKVPEPHYITGQPNDALPILVHNKPLIIQNIFLAKLHTAILTKDPESNLYISGFGPGGRLGTGDEATRFSYVCIEGGGLTGQRIIDAGLGQNHTIAVSDTGDIWSWGSNDHGQLGYNIPTRSKEERGIQLTPRQLFGPLKREVIIGAAASQIHSVVHTSTSLFTFGRNAGQLGLVDSDARSLEIQSTPRRVAASLFSSPITHVTAIERATICLLENYEVWIFANFGYTKMSFPLETFSNYFIGRSSDLITRYDMVPYHIVKVAAGGDTISALSSTGEVFTITVSQKLEPAPFSASTTNPSKIRGALSQPQCIYSSRKRHMAVVDVDVSQNGSIIICTEAGSVWVREKRGPGKDNAQPSGAGQRPRGFKFRRIPGLTRVKAVRSNAFGAFAAVGINSDVTKRQILVSKQTLWDDLMPMLHFTDLPQPNVDSEEEGNGARLWAPSRRLLRLEDLRQAVIRSTDLEAEMLNLTKRSSVQDLHDLEICTTIGRTCIPTHRVLCSSRSRILRRAFAKYHAEKCSSISDSVYLEKSNTGKTRLVFRGLDFLTITNLVLYLSQDVVVDVWHFNRVFPKNAFRYRQVRLELMAVATLLELPNLENAVRQMIEPKASLSLDLDLAVQDPTFLTDANVCVQLAGAEMRVHSSIMVLRCPFFEGLFNGRASGRWLSNRRETLDDELDLLKIDLKHIEPKIFTLVLRHIYSDRGEELFDDIVCQDLEEFSDLVLDVMSTANELMLDRLSQVCQKVLGRFGMCKSMRSIS
jgi:alpha-tubulin suppressor-like RCC1 family protein